jgi:hypothetical protein
MRAEASILKCLFSSLNFLHAGRRRALRFGVEAVLKARCLVASSMGRAGRGDGRAKHSIKRVDRLLGNAAIAAQMPTLYSRLAAVVVGTRPRPVVLVDWTALGKAGNFCALVASVPTDGRALIVFSEVHPLARLSHPMVERRFVLRLIQDVLPKNCAPIIVTDAGFRTPWFDVLRAQGVDFVGRLRHRSLVHRNGVWLPAKSLYPQASCNPLDLGIMTLTRSRPRPNRLVLIRQPKRGRIRRTASGRLGKSQGDMKGRASAKEPWLLVTSLELPPERVVAVYAKRMQIEETFRDLKNHRFGWSLEDARCTTAQRWSTLLLVGAIATFAVTVIGLAAEAMGFAQQLIANTAKRRVFSLFVLGLEALRSQAIPQSGWRTAAAMLSSVMA